MLEVQDEFHPPFEAIEPAECRGPILFNSPHSGRVYPREFLLASRLDLATLRRSEDSFVDELIVGTVHVLGLPVPEKTQLVRMMQGLGQTPFDPPNVKGWPGGESWITTYTLLLRQQFLRRIVEATTVASMEGAMM